MLSCGARGKAALNHSPKADVPDGSRGLSSRCQLFNSVSWFATDDACIQTIAIAIDQVIARRSVHLFQSIRAMHRVLTALLAFDFVMRIVLRCDDGLTVQLRIPDDPADDRPSRHALRRVPRDAIACFESMRHCSLRWLNPEHCRIPRS